MKKIPLYIFAVIIAFAACTAGEPQINRQEMKEIEIAVRIQVDSFKKVQRIACYQAVLEAAQPRVDSVLAVFEAELLADTLFHPKKPSKPEKPKVLIPEFTEEVLPKSLKKDSTASKNL